MLENIVKDKRLMVNGNKISCMELENKNTPRTCGEVQLEANHAAYYKFQKMEKFNHLAVMLTKTAKFDKEYLEIQDDMIIIEYKANPVMYRIVIRSTVIYKPQQNNAVVKEILKVWKRMVLGEGLMDRKK